MWNTTLALEVLKGADTGVRLILRKRSSSLFTLMLFAKDKRSRSSWATGMRLNSKPAACHSIGSMVK